MDSPIQLKSPGAEIHVPDGKPVSDALKRTTHLGVCAHQDDLEFMAYHGILECFGHPDNKWFTGVTVTNGSGSARDGHYKDYTDEQMMDVRKQEQKKAASIGEYAAQFLLHHPSKSVKDPANADVAADLDAVLAHCRPRVVYTHNFQDKHDTHVAVALRVIAALRRLPKDRRPKKVIGCEVWRSLDWLCDKDKVVMPVDGRENLADALMGVFDSQICGGKRYDLATRGRRLANATYFESHEVDKNKALAWGMDMTPLIENDSLDPFEYTQSYIERFSDEVRDRIRRMSKPS
jgi:LmbE family N-acetylglucosaminyl deacetylase